MTKQWHIIAVEIDDETGAITALSQTSTSTGENHKHDIERPDEGDNNQLGWRLGRYKNFSIYISQESTEAVAIDPNGPIACPDCGEVYTQEYAEDELGWVCYLCKHALSSWDLV